ncbi:MAG: EamA/RhaT family transporter, partial [Betaproteobacteria bacterium]
EGVRSLWIFVGVLTVSAPIALYELSLPTAAASLAAIPDLWAWIGLIAVTLFVATHAVQFGLARISPNRVIVILLFELIVVAVTGVWWADEVIELREWIGGAMILAATLVTASGVTHDTVH